MSSLPRTISYEGHFSGNQAGNPFKGFAVTGDYFDAVTDDITLIYISATWADLEPEKDNYSFEKLFEKNFVREYAAAGKKVVFRLICDRPGSEMHRDIPDWLYRETGDGVDYSISYGRGYSPNYSNEVFLVRHKLLLKEINKAFGQFGAGQFLAYVQLGTVGHWGEWHTNSFAGVNSIGSERQLMRIVDQYVEAFPRARLMMRRSFAGVEKYGLGVFNDVTGASKDTYDWLGWLHDGGNYDGLKLYRMKNPGEKEPVGGEFTSALSWRYLLLTGLKETKQLIALSHQSFIGPKCPHEKEVPEHKEAANEIAAMLGYNLYIREVTLKKQFPQGNWKGRLKLRNKGIGSFYFDWPLVMYIYNREEILIKRIVIADSIRNCGNEEKYRFSVPAEKRSNKYGSISIAIENPVTGEPGVKFCNDGERVIKIWQHTK